MKTWIEKEVCIEKNTTVGMFSQLYGPYLFLLT